MKCLWMSLNYADTNRLEPLTYKRGRTYAAGFVVAR